MPASDWEEKPLYRRPLTDEEVAARLAVAHTPFHRMLDRAISELLAQHDRVLVLDLHSFGMDLGVDVGLGDQRGATASRDATAAVRSAFEAAEFAVGHNRRFPGGWIVKRAGQVPRVEAVQVELNQRVYLDPSDSQNPASVLNLGGGRLSDAALRLERVVDNVARSWRTPSPKS